jgi:hypothetical protein
LQLSQHAPLASLPHDERARAEQAIRDAQRPPLPGEPGAGAHGGAERQSGGH